MSDRLKCLSLSAAGSGYSLTGLLQGVCLLAFVGALAACSEPQPPAEETGAATGTEQATVATDPQLASANPGPLTPNQMAQWSRNCALCHVRGEGGAPVLGDRQAWAERWQQGERILLEHTVAGLNNMPPLGYCMDCEEADFLALIRFMGGER